jgi:isoleucyl-tRNA synthetase
MSKSKGNFVAPEDVIKKYGRDALRLYFLSSAAWDDFYFSWQEADRMAKMLTVIENSFNFVKMYSARLKPSKPKPKLNIEDKWILSRLNTVILNSTKDMSNYNIHKAANEITDFIVNDFSRWYIKIIRDRVWPDYDGDDKLSAFYTLNVVAETSARLLAPICPFIAEGAHKQIEKKPISVHMHAWPKVEKKMIDVNLEAGMNQVKEIVEAASALRQEHKIKLRWPLSRIVIKGRTLRPIEDVIKMMCNIKKVEYGEANLPSKKAGDLTIYLDVTLTEPLKQEALLREVVRKVQELRKQQKLVVRDRIKLTIEGADELQQFTQQFKDEVGAKSVIFGHSKKKDKMEFEGKNVFIDVEKV